MAAKTTDPIDILLEMGIDLDNLSEEEDYLSALKEAIATIEFKTGGKGDERSAALREEVKKVRKSRRAADPKIKAKKITIKPENNMAVIFGGKTPHFVHPTKSPKTFNKGRFSVNCWIGRV